MAVTERLAGAGQVVARHGVEGLDWFGRAVKVSHSKVSHGVAR